MKLFNTLSRQVEEFEPRHQSEVTMYSCGPTVYDHIHIGNLSAFISADTLRRALTACGYNVKQVMNFTDVDDKTIRRSAERYADKEPRDALSTLTKEYEDIFLKDMASIGNDIDAHKFVRATESIEGMRQLIGELYRDGYAYITEDGVYFSIDKYKQSGKKYGQLIDISSENTSSARIDNDEYDKESVHDFALWKTMKEGEPSWEFELDGHLLDGRPGWHIECSVMSVASLGQPFDIHTGGIDLIFPHHENEIAQSTAGTSGDLYAKYFVHNEHLLVDGKKMSKSLSNFFTVDDVRKKGYDALAFRLMVLQSHYRNQSNFTWDNLQAAENRLAGYKQIADMRWQTSDKVKGTIDFAEAGKQLIAFMSDDLNTPQALVVLSDVESKLRDAAALHPSEIEAFEAFMNTADALFGLSLLSSGDIDDAQKQKLKARQGAKDAGDWAQADTIRDELKSEGIAIRDTKIGQVWYRS